MAVVADEEIYAELDQLGQKLDRVERRIRDISTVDEVPDTPPDLGSNDAGRMWRNSADGKTYLWTGSSFIVLRDSATQITTTDIAASTITAANIAAGTITATQIAAGTITATEIAAGTITATEIAADSITATHLQANSVTAVKILAGAVVAGKLSADSVSTANLQAGAVTATKITAGTITSNEIAAATITAVNIASATITATQIAANTITALNIAVSTITATQLAADSVTATQIAANAVTTVKLNANAVTAAKIAANTITATNIAAATITATEIASATITGALIAASTITATNIATGTITGNLIAGATITGSNIVSGTITSTQISVSQLDAVSSNMGTLTAGKVLIGTAGGAKIAVGTSISTSTGSKDGIIGTDSSNAITFWIDPATGNLSLKGSILSGSSGLGNISGSIDGGSQINSASITNDRLVANTITAAKIAAGTITGTEIAAVTITAGKIVSGTITATQIAVGTITADRMNITSLSAITADLGMITAGTITGATFQSSASNPAVRHDSTGFYVTKSDGSKAINITATDGIVIGIGGGTATLNFVNASAVQKGQLWTSESSSDTTIDLSSHAAATVQSANARLTAFRTGSLPSYFEIRSEPGDFDVARVRMGPASLTVNILKNDGTSDFAFKNNAALIGTPIAPTATTDTNTTQIATTAFVVGQASTASPSIDGSAAAGTSLRYSRQDHVHPTDTTRAPLAGPTFTGLVTSAGMVVSGSNSPATGSGVEIGWTGAVGYIQAQQRGPNASLPMSIAGSSVSLSDGTATKLKIDSTGVGFFAHATQARPAAYTLNAGAVSRNLPSGATLVQTEQALRQLFTDLQGFGLLQ